jgi:hypothetical protein
MTVRAFRCRECGYPFRTAEQGWARDAALMCPACGSTDVSILAAPPRWDGVTWSAAKQRAEAPEAPPASDSAAVRKKANKLAERPTGTEQGRSR